MHRINGLLFLIFSCLAGPLLASGLEAKFKAELAKKIDEVRNDPTAEILKQDRFYIWSKEIDGKKYVFKKRQDGRSFHELMGVEFGERHNIRRYDESKRVKEFVAKNGLKHVEIPGIYKVRFLEDGKKENDLNTGIVEEFVDLPDVYDQKTATLQVKPSEIPLEATDELYRLVNEAHVNDPHIGNIKYDGVSKRFWLTDLEILNSKDHDLIESNKFLSPIRPYLAWQLRQEQKIEDLIMKFGVFNAIPLQRNDLALKAVNSALTTYAKKEVPKILTAVAIYKITQYTYHEPYNIELKISSTLNLIDTFLDGNKDLPLEEAINASVHQIMPSEKRAEVMALFAKLYTLTNDLQQYVNSAKDLEPSDETIADLEGQTLETKNRIKKLWTRNLLRRAYNAVFSK